MRHCRMGPGGGGGGGVSWDHPRAFMLRGFLSEAESDHLIALAEAELQPSTVVDSSTGGSTFNDVRTSFGMFLRKGHDEVVQEIENRLARVTLVPVSHGESLQILRYEDGQKVSDRVPARAPTPPPAGGARARPHPAARGRRAPPPPPG